MAGEKMKVKVKSTVCLSTAAGQSQGRALGSQFPALERIQSWTEGQEERKRRERRMSVCVADVGTQACCSGHAALAVHRAFPASIPERIS